MVTSTHLVETEHLLLRFGPISKQMDDHDFFEFCQLNPELRIERTSEGDLIIMPPTGGETGLINSEFHGLFYIWKVKDGTGHLFESSTGFTLPNGAKRSPDLSWVKRERWDALSKKEKSVFPPLCPDFVAEIRSKTDNKNTLMEKMLEYMENGAQLGWLIDPIDQQVLIFQPNQEIETVSGHAEISGEPLLHGFVLDTRKLW
jgi:Uma2 family endonuclease